MSTQAAPSTQQSRRAHQRLVALLAEPEAFAHIEADTLIVFGRKKSVTLRRASFGAAAGEALLSSGSASRIVRSDGRIEITLTEAGQAEARRLAAGEDGFLAQHRAVIAEEVEVVGGKQRAAVNLKESRCSGCVAAAGGMRPRLLMILTSQPPSASGWSSSVPG